MGLFQVVLGVDHAARDTGRLIFMTVMGRDRLSAAIEAEEQANGTLTDPVEYTQAMQVKPLRRQQRARASALAAAA